MFNSFRGRARTTIVATAVVVSSFVMVGGAASAINNTDTKKDNTEECFEEVPQYVKWVRYPGTTEWVLYDNGSVTSLEPGSGWIGDIEYDYRLNGKTVKVEIECETTTTTTEPSRKVWICHLPPGNPDNPQWIEIDRNALDTHLGHGDFQDEGRCVRTTTTTQPEVTTTTAAEVTTTTAAEVTTTTAAEVTTTTAGEVTTTTVDEVTTTTAGPTTTAAATTTTQPTTTTEVVVTTPGTTVPDATTTTVVVPPPPTTAGPPQQQQTSPAPTCEDFANQADAQAAMNAGVPGLDVDSDGIACEQDGTLPSTGSNLLGWLVLIAVVALVLGGLAVAVTNYRRNQNHKLADHDPEPGL